MTDQQIAFFLSAAGLGSFTLAAEKHFTTQPTVSRQIALLESELGFALLDRSTRKLRLTPAGEIMRAHFQQAGELVERGLEQVRMASAGLVGKLSVGLPSGTNKDCYVFPEALRFARENPGAELRFATGSFSDLRRGLSDGELDVIFTFTFELPALEQIRVRPVYRFAPLIVMSADHPLAGRTDLVLDDFREETFLVLHSAESSGRERQLTKSFAGRWDAPPRVRFVPNINTLLFCLRAGQGVAALDSSMQCAVDGHYFAWRMPEAVVPDGPCMAAVWKRANENPLIPSLLEGYPQCPDGR